MTFNRFVFVLKKPFKYKMLYNNIILINLFFWLLIFINYGCSKAKKNNLLIGPNDIDINLSTDNSIQDRNKLKFFLLDPKEADIVIKKFFISDLEGKNYQAADDEEKKLFFPKLELDFVKADFVKILRCNEEDKDFHIISLNNKMDFESFSQKTDYDGVFGFDQYQRFWNSAENNSISKCVYVGTHMVRKNFFDLSAPDGNWFYLINPCVSKQASASGAEGCSYKIKKTKSFEFKSFANDNFYNVISQLDEIESKVARTAEEMKALAMQIALKTVRCEVDAAIKAHNEAIANAWKALAVTLVSLVVKIVFSITNGLERHIMVKLNEWINPDKRSRMEKYEAYRKCEDVRIATDKFDSYKEKINEYIAEVGNKTAVVDSVYKEFAKQNKNILNYYSAGIDIDDNPHTPTLESESDRTLTSP